MRIHWLQHVAFEGLGSIAGWAAENGCPVTGSRMFAGDALPPIANFDMLVIMGGPMSVNDEVVHPWLVGEKRFINQVIQAGKMVLGICLGAQLIASVAGARVYPADHQEIGWFAVEKTRAARQAAVGRALADKAEVFHWHGETFDLPDGARASGPQPGLRKPGICHGATHRRPPIPPGDHTGIGQRTDPALSA